MSSLLKSLLDEVRAQEGGGVTKIATAPNEAPTVEQQNADILETSQAMISKIDNFLQQSGGAGQDPSQDPQATGGNGGNPDPVTGGDPNDASATGSSSVTLEVPAGMSVKLASVNPVDGDSALRAIIGFVPSYFGGE